MDIYSIYLATNKINNKVYVGFTWNLKERMAVHRYAYRNKITKFYNAIRSYGWGNFNWKVIYQSTDKDYCCNVMEPFFISEYSSFGENSNGYNMTIGGEGGNYTSKDWIVTDPDGKEIGVTNLHKFCINNDLTFHGMWRVANHGAKLYKEWNCRYAGADVRKLTYKYTCTDINGKEYQTDCLKSFCANRGLFARYMVYTQSDLSDSYNGWTCKVN